MSPTVQLLAEGWRLQQAGDPAAAEAAFRRVLRSAPDDANAWCYLGMACHDQGRYEHAVAAYRRAIVLQPRFPIACNNMGNSLRQMRRLPEAVAAFEQAIALQPDYANAHTNLGVTWLLDGNFSAGWREYEWRTRSADAAAPAIGLPHWDGSSLDGRSIVLTCEQGLGDTVHFIRYAAVLEQKYECHVLAAVQAPLLRGCAGVDQWLPRDRKPPGGDCFAPLLSLPGLLQQDAASFPATVPYLQADPVRVEHWRQRLSDLPGIRIGIAWQGNPRNGADRVRSMPLAAFAPLARLAGVTLLSLQQGPGAVQVREQHGRMAVATLGDAVDASGAFTDTAAVLMHLDLVVSADTAVAHVAGALGVPVWLALAQVGDWRWMLDRDDSPWYPGMRLFRQRERGRWSDVFEAMAGALLAKFPQLQPKPPSAHRVADCGCNRLVNARHGLMLYNRNDRYIGRSLECYGEFSEGEVTLLRQVLEPGSVMVEAGANIGAHTLPLAACVGARGQVHAFEPQRVVFQMLCANVALAGCANVHCRQQALGAAAGERVVPAIDYHASGNFGGVALADGGAGEKVKVVTVDSLALARCDLIKADVEGMEQQVLAGAAATIEAFHPVLYLENDRQELSHALIHHVHTLGYHMYWHRPALFNPGNCFRNADNVFGNTVSLNMLCVHSSRNSSINGLPRVEVD